MDREQEGLALRWHLESWPFKIHKGDAPPELLEMVLESLHVVHGCCFEDLAWLPQCLMNAKLIFYVCFDGWLSAVFTA